ncbi:related to mei2 protein [Fusarium fujikuroi]|nr:related to mei2 protein [Fusarium fujikuroi]
MLEAEHYRPKLFYTIHSDDPNLIGKEETFLGPDNQSKMKRSVENAEHVGLFTPTAGQYFRDERRRRHSQYYGGLAQGSTLSATASSFEPLGQRFKGKNALVFYPEGGGAPSQDMDISHRIEVCDTPAPSIAELGNYITVQAWTMFRIDLPTLRITFLNTFPDILGDWPPQEGRPYEPPRFRSTWPDVMSEPPSCFETSRTRTANLLRRKLLAPLSGGPIACFDSGWPELFGDFVVSRSDPRRKAVFSNTTKFGVTPEEARELHQSQKAYDGAKATAAPDGGGIWDGGASKDDPSNLI